MSDYEIGGDVDRDLVLDFCRALGHNPDRVTRLSIDAKTGITVVELRGGPLERRTEVITTHRWAGQ